MSSENEACLDWFHGVVGSAVVCAANDLASEERSSVT